jgi:DNA-binding NtrC family response regulator
MKHILLLEDDWGIVDPLSTLLEGDGYYISSTARVAGAIQILQKTKVGLLIAAMVSSDGMALTAIGGKKAKHRLPSNDRQLAAYAPA